MQSNSLYLLANKIDVFTDSSSTWSTERYRRVYNRNLKIYQSVDNKIDLQVRNADQKATDISQSVLVFNLISRTGKVVLQRDCDTINAAKGRVTVTINRTDLLDLENGYYNYTVFQEFRETIDSTEYVVTTKKPMYMDAQYGVKGTIEIAGDALGEVKPALVVDKFNYNNPITTGSLDPKFFVSSIIDAQPSESTPQSLHTFQFYFTDYTGTVTIQGSIEQQGGTPCKWVDITDIDPTLDVYKNIVGKWSWFRIKHIPTTGTLDKVLYV